MPVPSTPGPPRGPNPLSSSKPSIPRGGTTVKKTAGFAATLLASAINPFRAPAVSRQDAFATSMNAEETFLANIPTIDRIAAFICRRHHVPDDAEEFASQVKLDL